MVTKDFLKPWKRSPARRYIFRHANVVDPVDGSIRENATVILRHGVVESVTETSSTDDYGDLAAGAIVIDARGRYLCPGLIDAHVHLTSTPGGRGLADSIKMAPDRSKMRQPFVCQQMLRRGFTSARDCGGATLALKEAIADGVFPGPRLFIAGHALSQTGGHSDFRSADDTHECCGGHITGLGRLVDGVAECMKYAREELRMGADFIKIMTGGGVASPTDALENLQFTTEEIKAITTVAANSRTYVTAHAYTPESIRHAIDNGVLGIEHGNLLDEPTAALMAEKGVFLTPTLITYSEMSSPEWEGFLPPESVQKNQQVLQAGLKSLQIAVAAGVTICFGTDLLGPMGVAQTKEFSLRAKVLTPLQVLQSATINPARLCKQEAFLGQIKPGFAADLLVLTQNPLQDITILDDPDRHLLAVIKEGYVHASRWSKLPEDIAALQRIIE
ncbi:hypothetical protein UA08_02467 [Talaromyces atroroseus]|uniref:Amidohydrolase-related domain-containing protein n=1 Tax=Talaromyces atroroseus TaxID=1441469 RepID=A0A225B1B7_TALAT|nr:hypothetical protein UA08_02467 [Talaromyces atroroseus]OKL61769.1 hypothetical protein UA08_02467 [Talaromyces atroroseus]